MSDSEFFVRAQLALDAWVDCAVELRKLKANHGTPEQITDAQIHFVYLKSVYFQATEAGYDITCEQS